MHTGVMADQERARFAATWDELETSVHVPVDEQVILEDVSVSEPLPSSEQLDKLRGSGMAGGYPVS